MQLSQEQIDWILEGRVWGRAEALLFLQKLAAEKPSEPISLRKLAAAFGWSHTQVSRLLEYVAARGWLPLEQSAGKWLWAGKPAAAKPSRVKPEKIPAEIVRVEPVGIVAELLAGLPRVGKMRQQLTEQQAEELVTKYSYDLVRSTLRAMDNYTKLGNYLSTYKTAANWLRRANNGSTSTRSAAAELAAVTNRAKQYDAINNAAASRLSSEP